MGAADDLLDEEDHRKKARELRAQIERTKDAQHINKALSINSRQKADVAAIEQKQNAREQDAEAHESAADVLLGKRKRK